MPPSLSYFINRAKVFHLYRELLKQARHLPAPSKQEIRGEIRRAFKNNIAAEPAAVGQLLSQGETQLKALRNQISLSHADDAEQQQEQQQQEPHEAEDERGRVGQGWPWARK